MTSACRLNRGELLLVRKSHIEFKMVRVAARYPKLCILTNFETFTRCADPSKNRQLYITAVTGHYYSCWLATLAPGEQSETLLFPILQYLLTMLRAKVGPENETSPF